MASSTSTRAPRSVPSRATGFHGDFLRRGSKALSFLPRHLASDADWESRIELARQTSPAEAVWSRAEADARRLGADDEALAGIAALANGDAVCVTTGQQPGLFLGPLYTVYKAMTALALARRIESKGGPPTVPVFWNAADDSDFGEVGTAFLPGDDCSLTRHALEGLDLAAGGMIGDLSTEGTVDALRDVRATFEARPSGARLLAHLDRAATIAADHGELSSALLYDLFRGTGLVIVDGRWSELRVAAAPLFLRYAGRREEIAALVNGAGKALEDAGYRARISSASTRSALFDVSSGRRVSFEGSDDELRARIERDPASLSPNVLLRPLVQDSLFPNVATVGGPGEISYHAQLAPEYRALGVDMPVLFPRFEATLVPDGVYELAHRREERVEAFVEDFDATMKRSANRVLPPALREGLDALERDIRERSRVLEEEARRFDEGLVGSVEQTERRAVESVQKLREKAAAAARAAETKRDPAIKSYREFLLPRGVPQERVLSALTLFLESEAHPLECLEAPLREHLEAARAGSPVHWLLDFRGCASGTAR
jgi:bacillithiol biosynthesis cysteine-adding enzyme BshC